MLENLNEVPDFFAVHNSYEPVSVGWDPDDAKVYRATLAAPDHIQFDFQALEGELRAAAILGGRDPRIAVTEHSSYFLPDFSIIPLPPQQIQQVQRNWSLGAALLSAITYHLFISNPLVFAANHFNLSSPVFQADLLTGSDGFSNPIKTAFGEVFGLYAQAAGGTFVPVGVENVPTYASQSYGFVPPLSAVKDLSAIAILFGANDGLWLYVVNRDLSNAITAELAISGPYQRLIRAEILNAASYTSMNTSGAPNAVTLQTMSLDGTPSTSFTFPAHSLVRLTFTP
jgi:hypothetical protein